MKKSLIALALMGAFSGAAFAQSNVTLYGIIDVNYMWEEVPTQLTAGAPFSQESRDGINSGHQSGSRWGLRGTEALGGGLNAIFTLEGGYNVDTGTLGQGGRLFGRQVWAGLQSDAWGAIVAGRLASFSSGTGSFDLIGRIDPFLTGFGLASAGNTFYSMNALRVDNTVAYVTPTWAGFKGGLGYSFNVDGAESANSNNNNTAILSGANWTYGPFFAAVTYDAVSWGAGGSDQKHLQIGGTFDIASFRLHGGWAKQDDVRAVALTSGGSSSFLAIPGGATFDSNSWLLGVTWNITPAAALLASYQALDSDGQTVTVAGVPVNYEPDYNIWSVGATYALSRRTNLYTSYASRDADGTLQGNSFNGKQFAIGVRHLF